MKKGVSLVSLVVIIIILGILAGIVVVSGLDSAQTINIQTFASELLSVQNATDEYYKRYEKYPVVTEVILNTSEVDASDLNQFENENIVEGKIYFQIIDISLLGIKDLEYGSFEQTKDIYVLSENTGKVYYLQGAEYENKVYYTLTEELYELLAIRPSELLTSNEVKKLDVIFVPSEVKYTNNPITVKVKMPKEATIKPITIPEGKSVSEESVEGAYKTFIINETTQDRNGNYTIQVNYTYNGIDKTVEYIVNNFDNTPPVISINETNDGNIRIIKVEQQDTESGIKSLKYAETNIEDASYFEHYGKPITGSELRLDFDLDYTIYAEDNAGNYKKLQTTSYAIYSRTDNSLTFIRTAEEITKGKIYLDKEVTEVYTGFEQSTYTASTDVPWYSYRKNIISVNVANKIQPINTSYWFYEFINCVNLDLTNLDTKDVTNMKYMFGYCGNATAVTDFKINGMSNWKTSKVTDMSYLFRETGKNATTWDIGDLSGWDTSSVTNMYRLFCEAGITSTVWSIGDLSNWKTDNVTDMANMFYKAGYSASKFDIGNLNNWQTSKVKNMGAMFREAGYNASEFNIGKLNSWDTSTVNDMVYMFHKAGWNSSKFDIGELDDWNLSQATKINGMFSHAGRMASDFNIGKLDNWDISKIEDMSYMFCYCGTQDKTWSIGDLSRWNTSSVKNMSSMFHGAGANSTVFTLGNLGTKEITKSDGTKYIAWDMSNVETTNHMFHQAGWNSAQWSIGDVSTWNTSNVEDMEGMFYVIAREMTKENLFSLGDLSKWDTSNVTNMTNMFNRTAEKANWSLDLSGWEVPLVTSYEGFNAGIESKVISPKFT